MRWEDAVAKCRKLKTAGLGGWRLPTRYELKRMYTVYHEREISPFINLKKTYWANGEISAKSAYYVNLENLQGIDYEALRHCCWGGFLKKQRYMVWPMRGSE
jgi:hypothetical protein